MGIGVRASGNHTHSPTPSLLRAPRASAFKNYSGFASFAPFALKILNAKGSKEIIFLNAEVAVDAEGWVDIRSGMVQTAQFPDVWRAFVAALGRAGVLALALWLVPAATSLAQLGPHTHVSIETRLARADRVVRATISSVERLPGDGDLFWERVTLDVSETIKGEVATEITFFHQTRDRFAHHQDIMDAGLDYLWFLVSPHSYELGWHGRITDDIPEDALLLPVAEGTIALGRPIEIDRGTKPPYAVVSVDLTTPRPAEEILQRARDAAAYEREHGEPTAHHVIDIAGLNSARVAPISGEGNYVLVPVDARLERLAHRLEAQPGAFAAPTRPHASVEAQRAHAWAVAELRRQGLAILATHFPTEANAPLFVAMLESDYYIRHRDAGLAEPARIAYPMRALAYTALSGMGRGVPRPELEAPIVDASAAPSAAAFHAVHGPRMEGLVSTEFLLELGGDGTPELLRLTYLQAKGGRMAHTVEDLRRGLHNPFAFTVFAFSGGEAIPIFHAGSDLDGLELQLMDLGGTPALVYQLHTKDPSVYACGWWDFFEPSAIRGWQTRMGPWKDDGRDIEFTGSGPLIWYGFAK